MNVNDKHFHPVVEPFIGKTIALADFGFRDEIGVLWGKKSKVKIHGAGSKATTVTSRR